jgi:GPN-loop GTPase
MEVFTWSASGTIITNLVASSGPSALIYVVDTARCENPNTFMSNMLFSLSIMYRTKLPLLVVLNKSDVGNYK